MASGAPMADWVSERQVDELRRALADPAPVAERRAEAFRLIRALPIEPNPLYRQYGYFQGVNLAGILPAESGAQVDLPAPLPNAVRCVHDASGTRAHVPEGLAQAGVRVWTLDELWRSNDGHLKGFLQGIEEPADRLSALGLALLNRGYVLHVPDQVAQPIRVQDLSILSREHEVLSVRRSVEVGSRAQVLFTEEAYSTARPREGQRLYASSLDLRAREDSKVVALSLHAPDSETVSMYQRGARLGSGTRLAWVWAGLGGRATKARNTSVLEGNGSIVHDLQTFFGDKSQAYDSSVNLTHLGTDTRGESVTRGVFKDEARGMSRGLVRIEKDARKTVSFISEHAMLLSKGARSDTIPILEILCRDVKATHSTSVAPVDPEKVFYLETRGVTEPESIRMVGEGFLAHVYDRAPVASLGETLHPLLARRWNGEEVRWSADQNVALPALDVRGTDAAPEWRFDSKLR